MRLPPEMTGGSAGDDDRTRQSVMPATAPDDQPTRPLPTSASWPSCARSWHGEKKTLPLYGLPDQIVVGRGTACDWQLDDPSLSRKHCQFRWNGKLLTVEDLGSANGTRVGGRSARQPLPVGADDVVQLGTVMVSFVALRVVPAGGRDVDAEATKLVNALPAGGAGETTPGPMPAGPTRLTPPRGEPARRAATQETPIPKAGAAGPPNARAAVFHPERDAAGADEDTREWDPGAALVHPPERNLDAAELLARLKVAWRTNRRPFVLGGAALWIALLLGLIALKQPKPSDDDVIAVPQKSGPTATATATTAPSGESGKPIVTPLEPAQVPGPPPSGGTAEAAEASADREQDLADAVAAYDNGRPQEALKFFKRLAADPNDKAARFMVQMIEARGTTP